jgi:hypothetical protein
MKTDLSPGMKTALYGLMSVLLIPFGEADQRHLRLSPAADPAKL